MLIVTLFGADSMVIDAPENAVGGNGELKDAQVNAPPIEPENVPSRLARATLEKNNPPTKRSNTERLVEFMVNPPRSPLYLRLVQPMRSFSILVAVAASCIEEGTPISLVEIIFAPLAVLTKDYTPTEKAMHLVEHQRKARPITQAGLRLVT